MKRFLVLLMVLLVLCPVIPCHASNQLVASGTVTQANMRISAVDGGATASGGAFVDFGAANVLTSKLGNLLVIKDSLGHSIQGWIKAAGSAEGLGDEIITVADDRTFGSDTGFWTKEIGWTINDAVAGKANHAGTTTSYLYRSSITVASALYKAVLSINGNISLRIGGAILNSIASSGTYYITSAIGTQLLAYSSGINGRTIDDVSLKQVLTPSATGVTIVSTKGGATFNWSAKDSAFNYNDTSGYTYLIYKTPNVLITSGTFTAANARNSFESTSAFCEASGLDLSPYAGTDAGSTPYLIVLEDASGDVAWGFGGAVGGGEALSAEINSGTLTIKKLYQITATEVDHFGTGLEVNEYFVSAGTETCDANNKVKNVTDCAVTGLHIMSARNGTDRGWKTIGGTFGYNDAMKYRVYYLGN